MIAVVGSGPAGVAAAQVLLDAGHAVTLIDGGITLEDEIKQRILPLKSQPKAQWPKDLLQSFKAKSEYDSKGVQLKRLFGSDFPYREIENHLPQKNIETGHITPSLAVGGFSQVWGAAMMPYSNRDLVGWPLTADDLKTHYAAVLKMTGLSAEVDGLEPHFPLLTRDLTPLKASSQAKSLQEKMKKNESCLSRRGFWFGKSRLAIRKNQCVYCGQCLYGCPKDIIFCSAQLIENFKTRPQFTHTTDFVVDEVVCDQSSATLKGRHRITKAPTEMSFSDVFLASGVISTTRIVLKSLKTFDQPVSLSASEYFMLPLLAQKNSVNAPYEDLFTLSQLFFEVLNEKISRHWVHLQLYTYNDMFAEAFKQKLKILGPLFKFFDRLFTGRLMLIQGYLHSDESSNLTLTLSRDGIVTLQGNTLKEARQKIGRLSRFLFRMGFRLGFWPLLPMLNIGKPGDGRHVGGSFPMSKNPKGLETNLHGEMDRLPNVHIVDASVFPSVPAPTITFTAMANAHRIATKFVDAKKKVP